MLSSDSDSNDSNKESMLFFNLVKCGAKAAQAYLDLYIDKTPQRHKTLVVWDGCKRHGRTLDELYSQLRMSK